MSQADQEELQKRADQVTDTVTTVASGGTIKGSDVRRVAGQVANEAGNVTTNFVTGGLVGYRNGQFEQGVVTHAVDEGIGELTGRNLQRQALNEQRNAQEEAAAAQKRLLDDERRRKYGLEVKASNYAAMVREKAFQRFRNSLGTPQADLTDTLGA